MPITTGHPAIILPLCKYSKWFSTKGLIIGSISPDLEYLFHLAPKRTFGHSISDAWWFDLIICLVFSIVFHAFVRDVIIDRMPLFLQERFYRFKKFNWLKYLSNNWLVFLTSSLIGIYSHILWDSITHTGIVTDSIPILKHNLFQVYGIDILIYKVLQQLSSFIGSLYVIYYVFKLRRTTILDQTSNWYLFWIWIVFLGLIISIVLSKKLIGIYSPSIAYFVKLVLLVVSSTLVGLVISSAFISLRTESR